MLSRAPPPWRATWRASRACWRQILTITRVRYWRYWANVQSKCQRRPPSTPLSWDFLMQRITFLEERSVECISLCFRLINLFTFLLLFRENFSDLLIVNNYVLPFYIFIFQHAWYDLQNIIIFWRYKFLCFSNIQIIALLPFSSFLFSVNYYLQIRLRLWANSSAAVMIY